MISLGFAEMVTALDADPRHLSSTARRASRRTAGSGRNHLASLRQRTYKVYYLIAAWGLLATACHVRAHPYPLRTPVQMRCGAIRSACNSSATTPSRVRWLAFSLSSFFAGMAGALHALKCRARGVRDRRAWPNRDWSCSWCGSAARGHLRRAHPRRDPDYAFLNSNLSGVTEAW